MSNRSAFPIRTALVIALVGLLGTLPAFAQQARQITFNDAVNIALDQNVTIKRATNTVNLQAVTVRQERADFLPDLNFSTRANRNWGLTFDLTSGQLVRDQTDGFSLGLNTGVTVFDGFNNTNSLKQARVNLEANNYDLDRTKQTVVFNVVQNFLQVILDQERIRIQQENVTAQQQQLTRIEEFTNVGTRPISDLYQQQATLASAELRLLEAERALQLSETRLIQVLQLDPLGDYEFTAPNSSETVPTPQMYNPQELLRSALSERADLRAQEASIAAADLGIKLAKSSQMPRVSLSGSTGSNYTSRSTDGFGSQIDDNRSESVGINLSVPIFNGFQTRTNIERARVQYNNAQLEMQNLQQSIALDVRQAYLDYQTDLKRLETTEKQLRASEQALAVEQERYNVGASTLVELTQARATYVEALSGRAQAVYQFIFQEHVIRYYQGTLNPNEPLFR